MDLSLPRSGKYWFRFGQRCVKELSRSHFSCQNRISALKGHFKNRFRSLCRQILAEWQTLRNHLDVISTIWLRHKFSENFFLNVSIARNENTNWGLFFFYEPWYYMVGGQGTLSLYRGRP